MRKNVTMYFWTFIAVLFVSRVTVTECADEDVDSQGSGFEDTRCRCICPDPKVVDHDNNRTEIDKRRFYTRHTGPQKCNAEFVVGEWETIKKLPQSQKEEFITKCVCKYESRSTKMLQVVVIFVICVIGVLVLYMVFLLCLDPMLRRQRTISRYQHHTDEVDDNMFGERVCGVEPPPDSPDAATGSGAAAPGTLRPRASRGSGTGVLDRVEAEQSKWRKSVQEQRKNIFTDHTMLN